MGGGKRKSVQLLFTSVSVDRRGYDMLLSPTKYARCVTYRSYLDVQILGGQISGTVVVGPTIIARYICSQTHITKNT